MSLSAADIGAQISLNQTIIAGWQAALSADAADPKMSYREGDEEIPRDEWREKLVANIEKMVNLNEALQKQLNGVSPWIRRTRFTP